MRTEDAGDARHVNVLDFGAVGDGVTDDTDAFRRAYANVQRANSVAGANWPDRRVPSQGERDVHLRQVLPPDRGDAGRLDARPVDLVVPGVRSVGAESAARSARDDDPLERRTVGDRHPALTYVLRPYAR
jgi:hypothetical protein